MAYSEKAAEHYRGVELQLWSGGATVLDAKLALQSAWEVPRKELLASYSRVAITFSAALRQLRWSLNSYYIYMYSLEELLRTFFEEIAGLV